MDSINPTPMLLKIIVEDSAKNPISGYIITARVMMATKFSMVCFSGLNTGSIKPE